MSAEIIEHISKNYARYAFVTVAVIACVVFFYKLDSQGFWNNDEAVYAQVIKETRASGDFLTLSHRGAPWFEKPPLYFWTSMGVEQISHNREFSYRFTAAVAGIVCVLFVMLITYEVTGNILIAALAGAVLLTMGPFVEAGRQMRLDVPAIASILVSVYCFLRGQKQRWWLLGVAPAIAVGVLFKSIIGLLAGVFILTWSILHRDFRWLKSVTLWAGVVIGTVVVVPWHLYETVQHGNKFWSIYVGWNLIDRFGRDVIYGDTISMWGYIKFFLQYVAPWSVATCVAVPWLWLRRKENDAIRNGLAFIVSASIIFALFFTARTRIIWYLVTAFPFIAVALAIALQSVYRSTMHKQVLMGIIAVLFLGGAINAAMFGHHDYQWLHENQLIANDERAIGEIISRDQETTEIYSMDYPAPVWVALEYYSGKRFTGVLNAGGQFRSHTLFLVMSTYYAKTHDFGGEFGAHLQKLYEGGAVTLYKFSE